MKKPYIAYAAIIIQFIFLQNTLSQVGIGTVDPMQGTTLQVDGTGGVLINRVSLSGTDDSTTITGLDGTQEGLLIYNTTNSDNVDPTTNVRAGFYYWNGSSWQPATESGISKEGWVALTDANTSYTLPFVNSPDLTDFTNFSDIDLDFTDDVGDSVISTYAPDGYDAFDFYDSTNGVITPLELGDIVLLRLQFDATPLQNNGVVVVQIDIGATPGNPGIIIYQKSIPLVRGGTRSTNVSETILLYQLGTFLANGGKIRMAYTRSNNTNGTTCDISNFGLVITKLGK